VVLPQRQFKLTEILLPIKIDASSSADLDGTIVDFLLDWGDGTL